MPHSTFKRIPTFIDGGAGKCSCGQTFNFESLREQKMKLQLHKKFCDKWTSESIAKPPRKAMTAKEIQSLITERKEFRE